MWKPILIRRRRIPPELTAKTVATLEDVSLIVSCVDDGEFYTTGSYRLAISCLYYYELLYTVVAGVGGLQSVCDERYPQTCF